MIEGSKLCGFFLLLQYALYFLVVGAAIWASSWAGENSLLHLLIVSLVFVVNVNESLKFWLQRYHVGCGLERGNRRR